MRLAPRLGFWSSPLQRALRITGRRLPLATVSLGSTLGARLRQGLALFTLPADLPSEWRLFVSTGLLGRPTTFGTFPAEAVHALQQGRLGWAAATWRRMWRQMGRHMWQRM